MKAFFGKVPVLACLVERSVRNIAFFDRVKQGVVFFRRLLPFKQAFAQRPVNFLEVLEKRLKPQAFFFFPFFLLKVLLTGPEFRFKDSERRGFLELPCEVDA